MTAETVPATPALTPQQYRDGVYVIYQVNQLRGDDILLKRDLIKRAEALIPLGPDAFEAFHQQAKAAHLAEAEAAHARFNEALKIVTELFPRIGPTYRNIRCSGKWVDSPQVKAMEKMRKDLPPKYYSDNWHMANWKTMLSKIELYHRERKRQEEANAVYLKAVEICVFARIPTTKMVDGVNVPLTAAEIIEAATQHEVDRLIAEYEGGEVEHDQCNHCTTWECSESRCTCGNVRLSWDHAGDLVRGIYIYPTRH